MSKRTRIAITAFILATVLLFGAVLSWMTDPSRALSVYALFVSALSWGVGLGIMIHCLSHDQDDHS